MQICVAFKMGVHILKIPRHDCCSHALMLNINFASINNIPNIFDI